MVWIRRIALPGVVGLLVAACESAEPTAVGAAAGAVAKRGAVGSCQVEITVPTTRPLPAVRAVAGQLNAAAGNSGSDLTCGQVRSLDAKINALAAALERRNFHAACGVSGGLVNELEALVESAQLDPITAPPFPGTSPNVVENAQFINSQFCAAARGELTPPPM